MSTVRIYKVAELLDTTSQEVLALLKRDHGIELKSASSTIEEVVARSFVERVARQRSISLPGGDMFAEHPAPAKGGGAKKAPAPKKAEPAKPTAPVLGPPRLVKIVRPATATPTPSEPVAPSLPRRHRTHPSRRSSSRRRPWSCSRRRPNPSLFNPSLPLRKSSRSRRRRRRSSKSPRQSRNQRLTFRQLPPRKRRRLNHRDDSSRRRFVCALKNPAGPRSRRAR